MNQVWKVDLRIVKVWLLKGEELLMRNRLTITSITRVL